MPTKSVWFGGKRCTVCGACAKGGETQNLVVVEESLVKLCNLSKFFEMLCQGGGRDKKTCLRGAAEQCWREGADCCDVRRGFWMFSRSGNFEETWRLSSECGDYEGANDAMVAKAMCQARLGTVIVETAIVL